MNSVRGFDRHRQTIRAEDLALSFGIQKMAVPKALAKAER